MPAVYKKKQCLKCNVFHRQRGPYCSQSCANRSRSKETNQKILLKIKKYHAWYRTLTPLQKLEIKENQASKKLVQQLKELVKDCNEIIDSLAQNIQPNQQYFLNNPSNPHLVKLIYTACPPEYHVDHIVPKARGGIDHQDNFQYLHKTDNLRKQDRLESELNFTLRKIDWKEAIEYDKESDQYHIKEEWLKEKLLSHPLYTLKEKIDRANEGIESIIEQRPTC